jgi:ABC-type transport system involved in multi-copper enzyme maturation permease subunit
MVLSSKAKVSILYAVVIIVVLILVNVFIRESTLSTIAVVNCIIIAVSLIGYAAIMYRLNANDIYEVETDVKVMKQ